MKKLLYILQNFFKDFIVFLISLIWLQYFIRTFWISLLISAGITLFFDIISRRIFIKKNNKNNLKFKEKEDAENMFFSLASSQGAINFFFELAKKGYPSVEKKNKYILISQADKSKIAIYPILKFSPINKDDITKIMLSIKNCQKVIIVCGEYEKDCPSFAANFDQKVILLDKEESYANLYKPYDFYPDITIEYKKQAKLTFRDLLAFSFNPARTKGYLISASIIFLSSFLVRASLYYCVIASLLLVAALVSYSNVASQNLKENVL